MYQQQQVDIFCYAIPQEGVVYTGSVVSMESRTDVDFDALAVITTKTIGDQYCTVYDSVTVHCAKIRKQQTPTQRLQLENRLLKNYTNFIHSYIKQERRVFYEHSTLLQICLLYTSDAADD